MSYLLFSVVVPTCQRNDLLSKCLKLLAPGAQTLDAAYYEVIVPDDGSKTTAEEMIRQEYPWVKWTAGPRRGPAANRNYGAKQASGEWLVFTDDDCLPTNHYLQGYFDIIKRSAAKVLEGKTSPVGRRTRVDSECPVNDRGGFLWSCNFAIIRDLFLSQKGFDENFPGAAMEDVDFHVRLKSAKHSIQFVPEAEVRHPWRARKGLAFQRLHCQSLLYYVSKHPEAVGMLYYRTMIIGLARKYLKQIPPVAFHCFFRGFLRELFLDLQFRLLLLCTRREAKQLAIHICL